MTSTPASPATRGGRPRNPEVDDRVRAAALAILLEDGYPAVTMESVARRAGVAHTTAYRRWPSKAHLVHEVLFPDGGASFSVPTDAGVEDVVTGLVVGIVASFSRPEARAGLPGLMSEYGPDGSLDGRLSDRFEPVVAREIDAFFAAASARGEARPGVDGATLLDTIMGFAIVSGVLHPEQSVDERSRTLLALLLHGALGGGG